MRKVQFEKNIKFDENLNVPFSILKKNYGQTLKFGENKYWLSFFLFSKNRKKKF